MVAAIQMKSMDGRFASTLEHPEGVSMETTADFCTQKEGSPFQKDQIMVLEVRGFILSYYMAKVC